MSDSNFVVTTTQSEQVSFAGLEALNAQPQYLRVYKISFHGNGESIGQFHDWSDDPEWALCVGDMLIWLNNGWHPDAINNIATIRCQRLWEGQHILITNPKV